MNNFLSVILIAWQTRNIKRHRKAAIWCRNYGLRQFLPNVYVGKLYDKERRELLFKFEHEFTRKTDLFLYVKICQSCYTGASFGSWLQDDIFKINDFEFIQISTTAILDDKNE